MFADDPIYKAFKKDSCNISQPFLTDPYYDEVPTYVLFEPLYSALHNDHLILQRERVEPDFQNIKTGVNKIAAGLLSKSVIALIFRPAILLRAAGSCIPERSQTENKERFLLIKKNSS